MITRQTTTKASDEEWRLLLALNFFVQMFLSERTLLDVTISVGDLLANIAGQLQAGYNELWYMLKPFTHKHTFCCWGSGNRLVRKHIVPLLYNTQVDNNQQHRHFQVTHRSQDWNDM